MRRLGLSIYPDKSKKEDILHYLKTGAEHRAARIFTCLLSVDKERDALIAEFREIHDYARKLGYEIIADVAPRVFQALNIDANDLSFFREIGVDGLRLDRGFTGLEESIMTFNPYGLKVEINMSNDVSTVDTIMDFQPDPYRLCGCFNFYPHNYSGLSEAFFVSCARRFRQYGLRTAAFICSQTEGSFGPWPVTEGLPTLEAHRHMPIELQLKHMIALGGIDDILVSNCYVSEAEWQRLDTVRLDLLNLRVALRDDVPALQRELCLGDIQVNRGDLNPNMIRSSITRERYAGKHFPLFHAPELIRRGDVVVESSEYGNYAGELQIALRDMKNNGKSNVVGRVAEEEIFLLDYLKPWQKFMLTEG